MKKTITILTSVFSIILFLSCKHKEQPPVTQGIIKYDTSIRPLDIDNRAFRKYVRPKGDTVTRDFVKRQLTQVLAIANTKIRFIEDSIPDKESNYISLRNADDPSGIFEIDKRNGRLFYNIGRKKYKDDKATENLPSEQEAIRLSMDFIRKLNIPEAERELSKPFISYLEMSVKKDDEQPQTFRKMIVVRFNRIVDGLRVEGASRLNFNYGSNAELTSLLKDWHPWTPSDISKEEVVKARELEKRIEQKLLQDTTGVKQILVTKRDLVLYDDGRGTMEPAIYSQATFTYSRKGPDGREEVYDIPRDFYEPVLQRSTAQFPAIKDRQARIQPGELNRAAAQDTGRRKGNTIDE